MLELGDFSAWWQRRRAAGWLASRTTYRRSLGMRVCQRQGTKMNKASKMIVAVLGSCAVQVMAAPHAAPHTAPDVVTSAARPAAETVDRFHAAIVSGNAAAARALLADDVLIFEGGAVERSADEYGGHHLPGDIAFAKAVPSTVTRRTGDSDGKTAWIASEGRTTGTYKGKPVDRISTETMLLVLSGDSWRIRHIHWSSRAATK